jgi:hypothetical protein
MMETESRETKESKGMMVVNNAGLDRSKKKTYPATKGINQ